MKRIILSIVAILLFASATAQTSDSVKFFTAPRQELKLPKGAEGYTIVKTDLFDSHQTISVIRYSRRLFNTVIVQPEKLTHLSVTAEAMNSDFGVNAGYWNISIAKPSTFLVLNGEQLSVTADFEKGRVDGLLCIGKRKIVIDPCKAGEEQAYTKKFKNILASGPALIDEGKPIDHSARAKDANGKPNSFYAQRHPRSAIGTDKKGNVYIVVVDGRSKGNAEGVSIAEFTKICSWLGMRDAINLDGGGSSSIWTAEEGTISYPSDNRKFDHAGERRISSCIVFKSKK